MFVFCQSLSYCAFLHTGMQQYFPFPPISSCFGRSSTVFSQYSVDSIGPFDDSSDFPLPMKSAVLFYRPGPRFHARKNITSQISRKVYYVTKNKPKVYFLMNLSVNKIICSLLKLSHCVTVKISIIYLICHFKKNLKCFSFINMLGKQYVYVIKLFIVVETLFSCFA